jgi:hypothetical protein
MFCSTSIVPPLLHKNVATSLKIVQQFPGKEVIQLTSWSMKYMNIDCFRELCIAFPPMIRDHVRLTFIQWMAVADYERTSVRWLHVSVRES